MFLNAFFFESRNREKILTRELNIFEASWICNVEVSVRVGQTYLSFLAGGDIDTHFANQVLVFFILIGKVSV